MDAVTQQIGLQVVAANIAFLLGAYQGPTTNLWEEGQSFGFSFFARSVTLQCFSELQSNTVGAVVPAGVAEAINWLRTALDRHWNGTLFVSVLRSDPDDGSPPISVRPGYDANIDIVLAALLGEIAVTDTRVLSTAADLRQQWADPTSASYYPINGADTARQLGPMFGRYPVDTYDGDVNEPVMGGHPWPVSTASVAELYYRLAVAIGGTATVPLDAQSAAFFADLGVTTAITPAAAIAALIAVGDAMLNAILFHSDHYQLSEQFDGSTGDEKSVANLTWSYAAFLSAARSRQVALGLR